MGATSSVPVLGMPPAPMVKMYSDPGKLLLGLSMMRFSGLSHCWNACTVGIGRKNKSLGERGNKGRRR